MNPIVAGNLKSKTSWVGLALLVLGGLDQSGAVTALLDLVPAEYRGTALSVLGGLMVVLRNMTTTPIVGKVTPPNTGSTQSGFARVSMLVTVLMTALALAVMSGCATNGNMSATSKVALQEVTAIAVRRAVAESPRAADKVNNIRYIASRLQSATSITSISELRKVVDGELDQLKLTSADRADANSLLNIFEALLREKVGKDEIDSSALVQVNEFVAMIVAALPAVEG